MNDIPILVSTARPGTPAGLPDQRRSLTTLCRMIATWRWRKGFRWELEQMSNTNPHLIDDIGLTRRQVEAEIAKPFWQA
jgi:uncharacterized protein YjiS (DUF1127 family)